MDGAKVCGKCGLEKPLAEYNKFFHNGEGKVCPRPYCIPCDRQYFAAYREKNREKLRSYSKDYASEERNTEEGLRYRRSAGLKHRFGLTMDDYDAMFAAQGGKCAICSKEKPRVKRVESAKRKVDEKIFDVDHNHSTGVVRGLLCHRCNMGIGFFQDDVKLLVKAARYLRRKRSPGIGGEK